MKCPTKQQDSRWQDKRCKKADKRCKTCREDWKKAQDRPQFSNRTNKCLNCAGDNGTCDCPTRQQPHTHPPLATLLTRQVFTKIIHNFKIICPNNTHNKVHDTGSRTQCIHYASSPHGKLGDEIEGRFNQDLPESLQAAFEKAMNFEPCILTKQTINTRRMNEVNQIDVTHYDEDFEVNEAHIQNPNYKGKDYDPNYQNKKKTTVITIIPAAAPATQGLDITSTTTTTMECRTMPRAHSRISQLMYK